MCVLKYREEKQNWQDGGIYYRLFAFITRFFTFRFSLFLLLLLSLNGFCQPGAEIGVIGGGGYYIGEYNPATPFKAVKSYFGGLYRYNLNDRFALRLNVGFSKIGLQDVEWPGEETFPREFSTSVRDICGLVEFNFRSFWCLKRINRLYGRLICIQDLAFLQPMMKEELSFRWEWG